MESWTYCAKLEIPPLLPPPEKLACRLPVAESCFVSILGGVEWTLLPLLCILLHAWVSASAAFLTSHIILPLIFFKRFFSCVARCAKATCVQVQVEDGPNALCIRMCARQRLPFKALRLGLSPSSPCWVCICFDLTNFKCSGAVLRRVTAGSCKGM